MAPYTRSRSSATTCSTSTGGSSVSRVASVTVWHRGEPVRVERVAYLRRDPLQRARVGGQRRLLVTDEHVHRPCGEDLCLTLALQDLVRRGVHDVESLPIDGGLHGV